MMNFWCVGVRRTLLANLRSEGMRVSTGAFKVVRSLFEPALTVCQWLMQSCLSGVHSKIPIYSLKKVYKCPIHSPDYTQVYNVYHTTQLPCPTATPVHSQIAFAVQVLADSASL